MAYIIEVDELCEGCFIRQEFPQRLKILKSEFLHQTCLTVSLESSDFLTSSPIPVVFVKFRDDFFELATTG